MKRLTVALALLALLGWCGLLFGYGLDDLTDSRNGAGVIFWVTVLPVLMGALLYALWRVARPFGAAK